MCENQKELVIVILNYIDFIDTDECVQSVLRQNYKDYHILIVDNNSNNNSYAYLRRKYLNYNQVSVIKTRKNYGFAKGNNIGICYAKKHFQARYVLLLNSDIVLEDPEYVNKMLASDSAKIGVIGSRIIEPNDFVIDRLYRYVFFPSTLFYYWTWKSGYKEHPLYQEFFKKRLSAYQGVYVLKGCVLLLTPAYFKYYKGLDPRTFLYCEEELLYLRCKKVGLAEKFNDNCCVYHKSGQSTSVLYGNVWNNFLGYLTSSYKIVLYESVKQLLHGRYSRKRKIENHEE